MQRLLSSDLWPELQKQAKKSSRRTGAIAYATKDLLLFRRGDTLVVDASDAAVRSAATDAKLLSTLERKGVALYSHPGLHAKVLFFDQTAFVGSSNLSASSHTALVEAGLLTDSKTTLSQVESFLEQLIARSERLDYKTIRRLCRIEVKRAAGPWFGGARKKHTISPLGDWTWLMAVAEADRAWTEKETAALKIAERKIAAKYGIRKSTINWIRMGSTGPFVRDGRSGNRLIQIWSANTKARPSFVYRATAVLELLPIGRSTFASIAEPTGRKSKIRWGEFKALMKQLGYRRRFGGSSECMLDAELADAISRRWNSA